ncbi:ribonuclease VapC [Synergistales bacterium]|nr:ribonuclease VapC [Synergistales bacterium]
MNGFLLDTNAIIATLRDKDSLIARTMMTCHFVEIYISSIVLFELYYGAFKSTARKEDNIRSVDDLCFQILDFNANDAKCAGEIRASLALSGNIIGPFDVLIAGQALSRDLTLITHNVKEFRRVSDLRIEDWHVS